MQGPALPSAALLLLSLLGAGVSEGRGRGWICDSPLRQGPGSWDHGPLSPERAYTGCRLRWWPGDRPQAGAPSLGVCLLGLGLVMTAE